ncbi:hypothetical protein L6164_032036 [Bauhinia variegata]|nr:hypothetical protein L6164_032036 [Bauhinia variegata]
MMPMIGMAKLFASRGIRSTIINTPSNASLCEKSIRKSKNIELLLIKFPAVEVGLPPGCENLNQAPTLEMQGKIFKATTLLEQQFDELVSEHRPDFLVADMFFPWASDVAAKYGIPRFVFHGSGFFPLCASLCLLRHQPHKQVSSDSEPFALPDFPDEIKFTRNQIPSFIKQEVETEFIKLYRAAKESERRSYGTLVNSFYELEPNYADHYRNVFGMRTWHIGPISLVSRDDEETYVDEHGVLNWLNSQRPNSVIYICFGSVANFDDAQLKEIAMGLEFSRQKFIWVVKREKDVEGKENWLPEGFEKRIEGKGVIVRGWAPQLVILNHEAVGGFVTHCGWNSILEAVGAGVSMVTWPISADQFYNEKLVIRVLKVGVPVGVQRYVQLVGDSIKKEAIGKAVKQIMNGEEAEEMRERAREFAQKARIAVELGGSSHNDLTSLIQELKSHTCRS